MTALTNDAETGEWRVSAGTARAGRQWEDVLAATHVAFDVGFTHRTPRVFAGRVQRRRFGDLLLVDCRCAPFAGRRGAFTGDPGESYIGFQTVRRGVERIRGDGGEQTVGRGEAVVWAGTEAVDVEVVDVFAKRTLLFPRDRVLAVCPRLADVGSLPPLGANAAARLLTRYVDALAMEQPALGDDEPTLGTATDVALELLRAAVEPGMPSDRGARRDAQRASVRRYIRMNLGDPQLGPESIARAHAMSLRALHALFEHTGESVAALVRRSRLARCRADLERPDGGSITEIAFRWGFGDAAHFSTAFKREFGVTPREVRRESMTARIGKESRTEPME